MLDYTVTDLALGDSAKGHFVNFLCSKLKKEKRAPLVMRITGAHQANHNVVLNDGRYHGFSQFGSGTFHYVPTFYMCEVCDPIAALNEAKALKSKGVKEPEKLLVFSNDCLVSFPFVQIFNQIEDYLKGQYLSCGVGVWHTLSAADRDFGFTLEGLSCVDKKYFIDYCKKWIKNDILSYVDLPEELQQRFARFTSNEFLEFCFDKYQEFFSQFKVENGGTLFLNSWRFDRIFEGAQGLLLDEEVGVYPYTTSLSVLDFVDCLYHKERQTTNYLITKTFMTRHGSGPFPSEDNIGGFDTFNVKNNNQGPLRYGLFDFRWINTALDYFKIKVDQNPKLVMTCLDQYKYGKYIDTDSQIKEGNLEQIIPEKLNLKCEHKSFGPKEKDWSENNL